MNVSCQYQIEYPSKKAKSGVFPSGPVVKTLLFNAGGMIRSLARELRFQNPDPQNSRSNIVTNSIKILKIIHIKKILKIMLNQVHGGLVDTQ